MAFRILGRTGRRICGPGDVYAHRKCGPLEVPGEGVRYVKVEEERLRLLDQDKNVITGSLADMYVLEKTQK